MSHALDALNAVKLSGDVLDAALRSLALLPVGRKHDPSAQTLILEAFAQDRNLRPEPAAAFALQARIAALQAWNLAHPPEDANHAAAVREAAARIRLVRTPTGLEFDPDAFDDFVAFVAAFPA
jgi:hypothetical protein